MALYTVEMHWKVGRISSSRMTSTGYNVKVYSDCRVEGNLEEGRRESGDSS